MIERILKLGDSVTITLVKLKSAPSFLTMDDQIVLFHPVSNFNTLRHQFESGKTQKTAGRRLSVAIGNTRVTIAITIIQV
jgi:hypothetical protein